MNHYESSSAVVLGCGSVGTAVAARLAGSGLGRVRLIDRDVVRPGDHRQISLFTAEDAGKNCSRAQAASLRLEEMGFSVQIEAFNEHLDHNNIRELCGGFGVLVDCLDNYQTKFLVNDFSVSSSVPWINTYDKGARVVFPGRTPCLQCLYPEDPGPGWKCLGTAELDKATEDTDGIFSFLAARAIRVLAAPGDSVPLDRIDISENGTITTQSTGSPDSECRCCGERDLWWLDGRVAERLTVLCGASSVQVQPAIRENRLDLPAIAEHFGAESVNRCNDYLLQVRIEGCQVSLFSNGRAIIKGIENPLAARILYSRYIGN